MKLTKRLIAGVVIAGFLATLLMVPQVADAGGRYGYGRGHGHGHWHGHSHGYYKPGYFWGGVAAGAFTGLVVGSILAPRVYAAPPMVYPAPVVVQPAPGCTSHWVPTYWNGYLWVPGYWAQTCQ
jgi:hypothetical protein